MLTLIFLVLLTIIILAILQIGISEKYDSIAINDEELPPLNYFTLNEPPFFFYDPEVNEEYNKGSRNVYSDIPIYSRDYKNAGTTIDDVFGPNNYFRYYVDSLYKII